MPITLEDILARTTVWTEPVSAASPAGASARFDPRYELTLAEVAKLDSPAGGAVDWRSVVDNTGELLRTASKDLLLAAHLAFGLYVLNGIDGLCTGVALLADLIDQFWTGMQPELKRIRGRVNALSWFIERVSPSVGERQVAASEREAVAALSLAVARLVVVVREKFAADAPALQPLSDAVERLQQSLPMEPSLPPVAPAIAPLAVSAPSLAAPKAMAMPAVGDGTDPVVTFRDFGSALAQAANTVRRAQPTDAAAYRVLRTGLWLHLSAAPPSSSGKTQVPPPPEALRAKLTLLAHNEKWPELVDEAESCLVQYRLWLDPHRISAQALAALGPSHAAARQALIGELAAFLRRLDRLMILHFADGTPLADAETQAWIESEVLSSAVNAVVASAPTAEEGSALEDARALLAQDKRTEAIALLQASATAAPTAARAFRARMDLARVLLETDQAALARGIFSGLDEEVRIRDLERWDPPLAAACLEGYLRCLRTIDKAGKNVPEDMMLLYHRLCRLDPLVAMRLGT